jgi:hypothetical protein
MPEGLGMKKVFIRDEWDFKTAGGCSNFGMHTKNPAFILNVTDDCEMLVRMSVLGEISADGQSLITSHE